MYRPRESAVVTAPQRGDLVIKPFVDQSSSKPFFRLETWQTHELIDGPFEHVRQALEAAFEFGVTARLAVWLDYTDDPRAHALDDQPLYCCDKGSENSENVA